MATLKQLSEMTGLSMNTISRVIRGKGYISEKTAKIVKDAIRKTDYHPNNAARMLRQKSNQEIVVISENAENGIAEKMAGIREVAMNNGFRTRSFIVQDEYSQSTFPALLRDTLFYQPSGLILISSRKELISRNSEIQSRFPCVWISTDPFPGIDCVVPDYLQATFDSVIYLYKKGRRRIAFYAANYSESCMQGYLKAMQELKLAPILMPGTLRNPVLLRNKGYLNGKMFAAMLTPPDAIITTDWIASGLLAGFDVIDWKIPEQTSIIVLNDSETAAMLNPTLTALVQQNFEMGRTAASFLLNKIKDPETPPQTALLKMALIIRQST